VVPDHRGLGDGVGNQTGSGFTTVLSSAMRYAMNYEQRFMLLAADELYDRLDGVIIGINQLNGVTYESTPAEVLTAVILQSFHVGDDPWASSPIGRPVTRSARAQEPYRQSVSRNFSQAWIDVAFERIVSVMRLPPPLAVR